MSEKRRDNKGRILRTGEGQRKDLTYQYRYLDNCKKRQTIYAPTLQELRKKEDEIKESISKKASYAKGSATVIELFERLIAEKPNLKEGTIEVYHSILSNLKKSEFGYLTIRDAKTSDAKDWIFWLSNVKNFVMKQLKVNITKSKQLSRWQ